MIEAYGLTRRFGTFTAVSQLSLQVPSGSVMALLGPNGAGKTTTVRMLAGLLAPTEGDATVAGYDIRREPEAVRACVGLVTDVPGLFEQMTVPAYLDFFGSIYGMSSSERSKCISALLEFFDLETHRKEKMAGFSKGMKQKVALARALIHEPVVLFLAGFLFLAPAWGLWTFAAVVAGMYVIDVLLIVLSAATWRREEVMSRL